MSESSIPVTIYKDLIYTRKTGTAENQYRIEQTGIGKKYHEFNYCFFQLTILFLTVK